MKKIVTFMILTLFVAMVKAQSLYEIIIYNDDMVENIDLTQIDSITYSQSANSSYIQNTWTNGEKATATITHIDSIVFNERYEYYPIISSEIQTGLFTNKGNYCFISNSLEDDNCCQMIVVSNKSNDNYLIAFADSLGLIRYINVEEKNYTIIYGKNEFFVFVGDTFLKRGFYDELPIENYYVSSDERNNINIIKKTCAVLCSFIDFISICDSNVLRNFTQELYKGRFEKNVEEDIHNISRIRNAPTWKPGFSFWIDRLADFLKLMQKLAQYLILGDINIETLEPMKNRINNYDLGCKVTYGGAYGGFGDVFLRDPNVSIILKDRSSGKIIRTETRTSASSINDSYYMNFDNLNLDSKYEFYPKVDAYFWMPDKPERLSAWDIGKELFPLFLPFIMGSSKDGEPKQFDVGHPGSTISEAYDITDKNATVDCQFMDLPTGATCYVNIYYGESGIRKQLCSSTEEKQTVSLSGLSPSTLHICQPVVEFNGKVYESINSINFTTDPPDISGTWSCKETHYDYVGNPRYTTYSITLGKDGKVKYSESSEIVSSSWGLSSDGSFYAGIMDLAMIEANSGKQWSGTVDNIKNPTKITGSTYRWNSNQIGYFQGDSYSFEMTR